MFYVFHLVVAETTGNLCARTIHLATFSVRVAQDTSSPATTDGKWTASTCMNLKWGFAEYTSICCVFCGVSAWIWNVQLLQFSSRSCLPGPLQKRGGAPCHPQDRCILRVSLSPRIPHPAESCPHLLAPPPAWPTPGNRLQACQSTS